MRPSPRAATLLLPLLLMACGDSTTEPEPAAAEIGSVSVSPASLTFDAFGDTARLSAAVRNALGTPIGEADVTWSSMDRLVATVDATGLVRSLENGSARIVAAAGGAADTASITVQQIAASVTLTPSPVEIVAGQSVALTASATDANDEEIAGPTFTWSSSDADVATVDANGTVQGEAEGTAEIVASLDGTADTAQVSVQPAAMEWTIYDEGLPSTVYHVWTDGDETFAAGIDGGMLQFDGTDWQPMTTGTERFLYRLWGQASNDLFAVGGLGTILHYDGTAWTPMVSSTDISLNSVWGSDRTNVYAVGRVGVIVHYDGSSWTPIASGTTEWFNGIWGSASDDIFAVGDNGTIRHFDGSDWTTMSSGTTASLHAIWGTGPDHVYAGGQSGTILHYDGVSWQPVDTGHSVVGLINDAWGSGPDDVYIVGGPDILLHYDGSSWESLDLTSELGSEVYFQSVTGSGQNEIYISGYPGIIIRRN